MSGGEATGASAGGVPAGSAGGANVTEDASVAAAVEAATDGWSARSPAVRSLILASASPMGLAGRGAASAGSDGVVGPGIDDGSGTGLGGGAADAGCRASGTAALIDR
jgi:hypothetical protein